MVPATPGRRMSPNVPTPGSGSFRFGCTERAERPSFSTRRRAKRRRLQLRPRSSPSPLRGLRGKVAGQRLVSDVSKLYNRFFYESLKEVIYERPWSVTRSSGSCSRAFFIFPCLLARSHTAPRYSRHHIRALPLASYSLPLEVRVE